MTEEKRDDATPRFDGRENQHTEFKQKWSDTALKTVAAFMNTDGGVIYIGICDNRTICGIAEEKLDKTANHIGNILDSYFPNDLYSIDFQTFENRTCIKIEVKKTNRLPVKFEGKYYKRDCARTCEMETEELFERFAAANRQTASTFFTEAQAAPQPLDVTQLSDAAFELIAGALLRERPVIVKPNGLFFEHERNQPRFIFDEPLKDRTFDDVLNELVEFKLFKKAGSFYEVAPLAQKNRKSIVELDSKRVLGALLQTSLGEALLKFANGEGARLSVDVAEIVPPDSHRTAMRRHDDFERGVPSNFSCACFPVAETDRIFHLLLKNLLVDKWDMSKDELSPPFSQAKIPWNNGNPINARFNLPEGGSLRGLAGMKREGAFAYGCITARLTERGCEISRLYLASNQGDD